MTTDRAALQTTLSARPQLFIFPVFHASFFLRRSNLILADRTELEYRELTSKTSGPAHVKGIGSALLLLIPGSTGLRGLTSLPEVDIVRRGQSLRSTLRLGAQLWPLAMSGAA